MTSNFIVIQTRTKENHISSSFRIEFDNEEQAIFALQQCFPLLSVKGVIEIENNELPIKIGNVGVQRSKERSDRFNRTGN